MSGFRRTLDAAPPPPPPYPPHTLQTGMLLPPDGFTRSASPRGPAPLHRFTKRRAPPPSALPAQPSSDNEFFFDAQLKKKNSTHTQVGVHSRLDFLDLYFSKRRSLSRPYRLPPPTDLSPEKETRVISIKIKKPARARITFPRRRHDRGFPLLAFPLICILPEYH